MESQLRIKGMRNASTSKSGLRELCELVSADGRLVTAVEVGVYTGEATVILSEYMSTVYAVDPWRTGYDPKDIASKDNGAHIRKAFVDRTHAIPNIYTLQMPSERASIMFADGTVDMVYIDANHLYEAVKSDIALWLPKVKHGGFISGHDYDSKCGVKRAVDESFIGLDVAHFCDSSWAVRLP